MWEILQDDIERKDFSIKLPWIIERLTCVSQVLVAQTDDDSISLDLVGLNGLGRLVGDVVDQLDVINEALYTKREVSHV